MQLIFPRLRNYMYIKKSIIWCSSYDPNEVGFQKLCLKINMMSSYNQIDGETGRSYTLSETRRISLQISAVLENRGLKKGDVVAVFLHNCPQFAFIVYGCMALGVTVSTISTAFTHGNS